VVAGVALEGWEIFHDVREELDNNRQIPSRRLPLVLSSDGIPVFEHSRTWIKTVGAIGWVLVVLGVAGELAFDSMVADFDTGIRLIDDDLLKASRSQATNAEVGAALAMEEAATANARTLREIVARQELEKELLWQGPRDVLIRTAQLDFVGQLAAYRRQRFRFSDCQADMPVGPINSGEIAGTALALAVELDISGWRGIPSQAGLPASIPRLILNCSANGVGVYVSPQAPRRTRDAAIALDTILVKVLSEHIAPHVISTAQFPRIGELPPVANDVIEILIGRHLQHRFDLQ